MRPMAEAAGDGPGGGAATGDLAPQNRVLTVPNALSVVRLVLVPVFLYLLLVADATGWAVAVLMFSGASDWADGKIARLFDNQSSRSGALLDPAVDRIFMVFPLYTSDAADDRLVGDLGGFVVINQNKKGKH